MEVPVLSCDWVRVWVGVCTVVPPASRLVYSGLETVPVEVPSLVYVPVSCDLRVPGVDVPVPVVDSGTGMGRLLFIVPVDA